MTVPVDEDWPLLRVTDEDWKFGEKQLALVKASGKTAPDQDFGDMKAGFAAERVVDRWLTEQGVPHIWNHDPKDPKQDFEFGDVLVDLKTHSTVGGPKDHYDTNLTEAQRRGSGERDWYLFAKIARNNLSDMWVLGFQTEKVIMDVGVFYRKGEITRQNMDARVDCWCIRYNELIKPFDWLGEYT